VLRGKKKKVPLGFLPVFQKKKFGDGSHFPKALPSGRDPGLPLRPTAKLTLVNLYMDFRAGVPAAKSR